MADRDIKARISLEDQLTPALEKIQASLLHFHGGAVSLNAALELVHKGSELVKEGFEILEHQLEKAFEQALDAEKATNRLTGAMVQAGVYTEALNSQIEKHVNELESLHGANGETVKSMIATGLQMGLNIDKSKELEQAARQLAAANNIDVNEAFGALQASLIGNSRHLGKLIPQVKELGSAQLKQGDAIKIVNAATVEQYKIYEQSLPAALNKSKVAIDNIYKAFGLAFTENAAVKAGVQAFVSQLQMIAEWSEHNKETIKSWVTDGILFAVDAMEVLNLTFDAIARVGNIAFQTIKGAIASVALGIRTLIDGPLALLYKGLSYIPGETGKAFDEAADSIITSMGETAAEVNKSVASIDASMSNQTQASKTLEGGILKVRDAIVSADTAEQKANKTKEEALQKATAQNAAALKLQQTYDGFAIGTRKQREQLEAQTQDRDKGLKDFNTYLDAHKRLAMSRAAEEEIEVNKVRAAALKGAGGSAEGSATAQVAIDAEKKKQADLKVIKQKGIIDDDQYNRALLSSQQRMQEAEYQLAVAGETAKADVLGQSEAGFALKQQLADKHFQLELQTKILQAQQEGATEDEINAMKAAANQDHLSAMKLQKETFIADDARQNDALDNQWAVTLDNIRIEQEKHGAIMGTIRGIQQSNEFKAVDGALGNLASLRSSHSKKAFELGKTAAIAQATINTFLAATEAFAALAPIPIVGPALGAAAAAAAIAAGFVNIQSITAQKFNPGGQADSGMDYIPQSLSGRSFVLSGGERVVQPTANKKLTDFLDGKGDPSGGVSKPTQVNITINGKIDRRDADQAVDTMIAALRRASERGVPIISDKGVVKSG